MITYEGTLKVTVEEFYTTLLLQIAADVNQKTGKNLGLEDIKKGCKYRIRKKVGNKTVESIIDIKVPVENKCVTTSYSSEGKNYKMIYELAETENGNVKVTYIQDDGSDKKQIFTTALVKSNMKKRLHEFEKYIISHRSSINEK